MEYEFLLFLFLVIFLCLHAIIPWTTQNKHSGPVADTSLQATSVNYMQKKSVPNLSLVVLRTHTGVNETNQTTF